MDSERALTQEAITSLLNILETGKKEGTFTLKGHVDIRQLFPNVTAQISKIGDTHIYNVKF